MGIANDIRPRRSHGGLTRKLSTTPEAGVNQPFLHTPTTAQVDNEHVAKTILEDEFFSKHQVQTAQIATQPAQEKGAFKVIVWFILFVVIVGTILYQLFLTFDKRGKSSKKSNEQTSSEPKGTDFYSGEVITQDYAASTGDSATSGSTSIPSTTVTPTQSQTSTSTTDKSKISIKVLNGNGVKNSADEVRDTLTAAGFSVSSVKNARTFSYATTIIYYQTNKKAEAELVKDALASRTASIEASDSLAGEYNVVVVVGKK
ncbi:MAG: LytR C-terminal domain-containing protein [Patescibacteria group bacterium]|jgi:hypothetical protein